MLSRKQLKIYLCVNDRGLYNEMHQIGKRRRYILYCHAVLELYLERNISELCLGLSNVEENG